MKGSPVQRQWNSILLFDRHYRGGGGGKINKVFPSADDSPRTETETTAGTTAGTSTSTGSSTGSVAASADTQTVESVGQLRQDVLLLREEVAVLKEEASSQDTANTDEPQPAATAAAATAQPPATKLEAEIAQQGALNDSSSPPTSPQKQKLPPLKKGE